MNGLKTVAEMAELLRVRPCTIKEWARKGRIPSVRPSRKVVLFDPAAVEAVLKKPARA